MNEQIYIDSPLQSLSDALSFHIKQQLGLSCCSNNGNSLLDSDRQKTGGRSLLLIDCAGARDTVLRDRIKKGAVPAGSQDYAALFNVMVNMPEDIELEAFVLGYRGVFYENISLDMLMKGIRAVFDGQVWLSRSSLNHFYEKARETISQPGQKKDEAMTAREREILALIASGCQNCEIGDKLCISMHTVKTHIYNLFKKIDVPNRFQAALWAASHRIKM